MAIKVCATNQEIESQLLKQIQECVDKSESPLFSLGLSGGSLPSLVTKVLPKVNTDWTKWRFVFCDERLVPFEDSESTFGVYKKTLLQEFKQISEKQFLVIDNSLPQQHIAQDYERRMRHLLGDRGLDLALLGMGPDGHTCSLFPDHPILESNSKSIELIVDSPKPPSARITMTLGFLEKCSCALFVALGESKAKVLREIFVEKKQLPAARVNSNKVIWILDRESARLLNQ